MYYTFRAKWAMSVQIVHSLFWLPYLPADAGVPPTKDVLGQGWRFKLVLIKGEILDQQRREVRRVKQENRVSITGRLGDTCVSVCVSMCARVSVSAWACECVSKHQYTTQSTHKMCTTDRSYSLYGCTRERIVGRESETAQTQRPYCVYITNMYGSIVSSLHVHVAEPARYTQSIMYIVTNSTHSVACGLHSGY